MRLSLVQGLRPLQSIRKTMTATAAVCFYVSRSTCNIRYLFKKPGSECFSGVGAVMSGRIRNLFVTVELVTPEEGHAPAATSAPAPFTIRTTN